MMLRQPDMSGARGGLMTGDMEEMEAMDEYQS